MQRLISLFREPEDPWPSLAAQDEEHNAFGEQQQGEPLYFADLMAYLRDRNRAASSAPAANAAEPREGAD